jgi:hypothetical protein
MAGKFRGGVVAGSIDVSIVAVMRSSSTGALVTGLAYTAVTAYYWRQGGSPTQITLSAGTPITGAHGDGKWFEADASNHPGSYRLDVTDAVFAAGADWVEICVTGSGLEPFIERYPIDVFALDSSGYVRLQATTHSGAVIPTVTTLTGHTPQTGDSYPIVNHTTYGNAKLVRSLTPANALGIDATNAAKISATGVALDATERNALADAFWARTLGTEVYAADGAVPTGAQAMLMLLSTLCEFVISGATKTCKKLDGSSTAMTFTITYDGG